MTKTLKLAAGALVLAIATPTPALANPSPSVISSGPISLYYRMLWLAGLSSQQGSGTCNGQGCR